MRLALCPILLAHLRAIGVAGVAVAGKNKTPPGTARSDLQDDVPLVEDESDIQLPCSLNGDLVDGKCRCDPQWEGDDCHLLKLLPADPHAGLQAVGNFSSWGGSVERDAAGTYHMYVAVMAHGCGLNAWRPNSQIGHATSSTPAGPYNLQQIILPHFAHSPDVVRGVNGEWLVYHVGAGTNNTTHCPDPAANSCRWTTNCSRGCTGPEHPWLSGLGFYGPASVMKASSPDGPWTDAVIGACKDVPGCEPHGAYPGNGNDQNPAPFINADGSISMLWRSINYTKGSGQSYYAAASAPKWSGPYTWHSENIFPDFSFCHIEDGFLYKNKRGWHALFHSDCQNGSTAHGAAGGHGYSADGHIWKFHAMNAYSNIVKLTDGTEWTLSRRERPKLILDKAGNPTHLINGISRPGAANGCNPSNHCPDPTDHFCGDHTFTFVQPIAHE